MSAPPHSPGPRPWWPPESRTRAAEVRHAARGLAGDRLRAHLDALVEVNRRIHDEECINLDPASNIMGPRAEEVLSAGLSSRPSLGLPGAKYETGLEGVEAIEVLAADAATSVFGAAYAEVRVGSGALANLYAFMATCRPGDTIVAPPPSIGGHVTHHAAGSAGLYGLRTVPAPVDATAYTVDLDALHALVQRERPRLVTVGGSLNLTPHPVAGIREVADTVGAFVLFDAAHVCGLVAGGVWPSPLEQGAHLMTMSTYKSLGGPAGGLVLTDDADLAARLDDIAFPGLTANFDAGRVAALAFTLVDWQEQGAAYAEAMRDNARALAAACADEGLDVFGVGEHLTDSHQVALRAARHGGGQTASRRLRRAGLLTCGIGLPVDPVEGDLNGIRLGTPEVTRRGMGTDDMAAVAHWLAQGLDPRVDPADVASDVAAWRRGFTEVRYAAPARGSRASALLTPPR